MKNIIISPKGGVNRACQALAVPYAVISIQDPGDTKPRLPRHPHRLGTLFLEFDDINPEDYAKRLLQQAAESAGLVLMNETHARQIAQFVADVAPRTDTLVVQCFGGVCRSGGVAAAIAHVLLGNHQPYFVSTSVRIPNRHAYLLTGRALAKATGRAFDETIPAPLPPIDQ